MSRSGLFCAVCASLLLLPAATARAQGGRRGGGDQGGRRGGWVQDLGHGPVAADPGTMIEREGKLYVVSATTLARVDLAELKVEARADLTSAGMTPEEEAKERKAWIARFDRDGDGAVTEQDDDRRWRFLNRYDGDGDGKVTANEAAVPAAPGASGPAALSVAGGKLVMLRGGMLFKFDLATLKLEASVAVAPPEPAPQGEPAAAAGDARRLPPGEPTPAF